MKIILNILFLFLLTFQALGQSESFSFEETFPASSNLKIDSSNSDFIIDSCEGDDIKIRYRIVKNGELIQLSKPEILKMLEGKQKIEKFQNESELKIEIVNINPKPFTISEDAIEIHFICLIPKGVDLEIKTNDGDIFISDIYSNIDLKTNDGDISLNSLGGTVQAKSNDGDIFIGDTGNISDLDLLTNEGDIQVKFLKKFGVTLSAKASSFELPDNFYGEKKANRIKGKIYNGGSNYKLNTLEGKITISE